MIFGDIIDWKDMVVDLILMAVSQVEVDIQKTKLNSIAVSQTAESPDCFLLN